MPVALRPRFHAKRQEVERALRHVGELKRRAEVGSAGRTGIDEEVGKALALFDDIERLAAEPAARAEVRPLLQRLNVNLFLTFAEGRKGKRAVRVLTGGVMTMGDAPLPVRPYGDDEDDNDDGNRPQTGSNLVGVSCAAEDHNKTSLIAAEKRKDVSLCKGTSGRQDSNLRPLDPQPRGVGG